MDRSENDYTKQLSVMRSELRNIRKDVDTLKRVHKKEIEKVWSNVKDFNNVQKHTVSPNSNPTEKLLPQGYLFGCGSPVGYMQSVFHYKNGTPRQGGICQTSQGQISISKETFNNPAHSLEGLQHFSHVWIIFIFHKNNNGCTKAKVKPPRLDGEKLGLFSTRCPYRPNPVGLTLAKLDRIEDATLYVSGIDIIDGTPILDIKPYIPEYDQPTLESQSTLHEVQCSKENCKTAEQESTSETYSSSNTATCDQSLENPSEDPNSTSLTYQPGTKIAKWIDEPVVNNLRVRFTPNAERQLELFSLDSSNSDYRLKMVKSSVDLKSSISSILEADPRSPYRRRHCPDRLHFFTYDCAHVTCWYDDDTAEVLNIKPVKSAKNPDETKDKRWFC